MHCFWAAWLLMGKTETLRGTGDTPFSHLQLWKSIHEGYLRPLLDVLHRIGFYHIFLSHTHLAHTVKKEITALNFLHVNLPFVRLLIPDFIFFFFQACNEERLTKGNGKFFLWLQQFQDFWSTSKQGSC